MAQLDWLGVLSATTVCSTILQFLTGRYVGTSIPAWRSSWTSNHYYLSQFPFQSRLLQISSQQKHRRVIRPPFRQWLVIVSTLDGNFPVLIVIKPPHFRTSLWLKYGLLTDEKSVITVNFIGTLLFMTYVIIFFIFTTNKKLLFRQVTIVVLVLISVYFYSRHEPDQKEVARVLGS